MRRYTKLRGAAKGGAEKAGASKGPWTKEEDHRVIELVKKHGPKRWSQIASELPGEYFSLVLSWVEFEFAHDMLTCHISSHAHYAILLLLNFRSDWQAMSRKMAQPSQP